jgi:hypothetical protein
MGSFIEHNYLALTTVSSTTYEPFLYILANTVHIVLGMLSRSNLGSFANFPPQPDISPSSPVFRPLLKSSSPQR